MLELILGRAGSGKSAEIFRRLAAAAEAGADVMFLVPEQMSFETERALLKILPETFMPRVKVLTFTRLVGEAAKVYGGFAGRRIDDGGRLILMMTALGRMRDMLTLYRGYARSPAFAQSVLSLISEFKQSALTPKDLENLAAALPEGELRSKLSDLSVLMGAYEALAGDEFADAGDDLARLRQILAGKGFFRGKTIFLDGFKGFTRRQFDLIELMAEEAERITAAFTADGLSETENFGVFSNVQKTAARLVRIAKEKGRTVAAPFRTEPGGRYATPALKELERRFHSPAGETYDAPAPEITLIEASTPYDEVECVAAEIRRLMREEGLRCRDTAVIARDLSPYADLVESIFPKYDIPFFIDARRAVDSGPLARGLSAALRAAAGGFSSDAVLEFLKTGLMPVSEEDTALLENYIYTWDLTGTRWLSPFDLRPEGFSDRPVSEAETALLRRLNRLRERIVAPLDRLREAVRSGKTEEALAGVVRFLDEIQAARALKSAAADLESRGEPLEAQYLRASWDFLMHALDQTALTLKDTSLSSEEFVRLLEAVLAAGDLGAAPPELDEVNVGEVPRMRPAAPKAVFLLGAAEGVFPRAVGAEGLLTPSERQRLNLLGAELSGAPEETAAEERFLAYFAVTCASRRVTVSYSRTDKGGGERFPSEIFTLIRDGFPGCRYLTDTGDDPARIECRVAAVQAAARHRTDPDPRFEALRRAVARHDPAFFPRIDAARKGVSPELSKETALRLYGSKLRISPSRAEAYHKCPFAHFCKYGLRAKPPKRAEMDALQRGTLAHFALEQILSRHGDAFPELDEDTLVREIRAALDEYTETVLGGKADKPKRFLYRLARIEMLLIDLLRHMQKEQRQSRFRPAAFELEVGSDRVPAPEIRLPEGSITVTGTVDRADVWKGDDGKLYLRVVDYKTGNKKFRLCDAFYGQNLQMLIYLFALCDGGEGVLGAPAVPAGVLYLPARRNVIADEGEDETENKLAEAYRMSGVVLGENGVPEAMEEGLSGIFIPVTTNKGGGYTARSPLMDLKSFALLKRRVTKLLENMGNAVLSGDARIEPVDAEDSACRYCDYASVCKKDIRARNARIPSMRPAEILEALAASEESAEGGENHGL